MIKSVLAVALIVISMPVTAKGVDWTPYLKGMQNECDLKSINANSVIGLSKGDIRQFKKSNMPKALQPSVASYKVVGEGVDIRLKNAVAFGQPIYRIAERDEGWSNEFVVYFSNANFTKIKPQFTMTINNQKYPVGTEKSWFFTIKYNDDTEELTYVYRNTNMTSAQTQKVLKKINNDETGDYDDGLALVNKDGWSYNSPLGGSGLRFDTKTKSISCWSWSE